MTNWMAKLLKREFEVRLFISFGIVLGVVIPSLSFLSHVPSSAVLCAEFSGLSTPNALTASYVLAAFIMTVASILRMWAGSILTSNTIMSFRAHSDCLMLEGPYQLVRHPIYLSDLIAMAGFSLVLPPLGLLLPLLLNLHYWHPCESISWGGRRQARTTL